MFIENNKIEIKNNQLHIEMIWRVPSQASKKNIALIKDFLAKTRESKIRSELEFIKSFYTECKETSHERVFILKPLNPNPIKTHINVPRTCIKL